MEALYVPFASKCADWGSDMKIAYFNNIHQYDTDGNGTVDKVTIEFFSLDGSAEVMANIPYLYVKAPEQP